MGSKASEHRTREGATRQRLAMFLLLLLSACAPPPPARGPVPASTPPAVAVDIEPAVTSASGATYHDHTELGVPLDPDPSDDLILEKLTHALSYNCSLGRPNWVSWNLNATHFGDVPRQSRFSADPELPREGCIVAVHDDYTNTGYSRGHLVRSEERTRSEEENRLTFLMSNVVPQYQELNAGPWLDLEYHLEAQARSGREVYTIAGPLGTQEKLRGRVDAPTHTWKIAVLGPRGMRVTDIRAAEDFEVIAVLMPNERGTRGKKWTEFRVSVDELERRTGYDFLRRLADAVEEVVEAQ